MKSLYTELASITDYMNKLSLSRPDIRFVLKNNDNLILRTDGSGNLLKVIQSIYGNDVARRMIPIKNENADYIISGYISLPEIHRSSRNNMVTIVNGRVVRNQEINRDINGAYHSYKPDNRYPITVINIEVDPSVIDVNIHPTKMDIKFSKMESLLSLIRETVVSAITGRTLIPEVRKEDPVKPRYENMMFNLERHGSKEVVPEHIDLPDEEILTNSFEEVKSEIREREEYEATKTELMPEMWPVTQRSTVGTYIVAQIEKGMYLIDEHAAKERCNYERFKKMDG